MSINEVQVPPTLRDRCELALLRTNGYLLALTLAAVGAVKVGVASQVVVWQNADGLAPEASAEALAYGFRTVGFLLNFSDRVQYQVLALVIIGLGILAIARATQSSVDALTGRVALIFLLTGPIVWTLAQTVGRPDSLLILGAALLAPQRRLGPVTVLALTLMILAHPEQSVLATLAFLILTFATRFRDRRVVATTAFAITLLSYAVLLTWFRSSGVPSRFDSLGPLIAESLGRFLIFLPLVIWTGLGATTVVVLVLTFTRWPARESMPVVLALFFLPLAATAVTLDQTRVYVNVVSLAAIAFVLAYSGEITDTLKRNTAYPLLSLTVALIAIPAVYISVEGEVIRPWINLYLLLQPHIDGLIS